MSTATIEVTRTDPAPADARWTTRSAGGARSGAATTAGTRSPATARPATASPANAHRAAVRAETVDGAGGIAPFVLLTMVLLATGLVTTLWLSTAAAADSYRLEEARQVARDLSEQSERLHREVEGARSAPALAAAAQAQGMVPGGDPAVLLVAPDGSTRVIGDARPVRAAPRSAPARPAPAAPQASPAPGEGEHAGSAPAPAGEDERLRAAPTSPGEAATAGGVG